MDSEERIGFDFANRVSDEIIEKFYNEGKFQIIPVILAQILTTTVMFCLKENAHKAALEQIYTCSLEALQRTQMMMNYLGMNKNDG